MQAHQVRAIVLLAAVPGIDSILIGTNDMTNSAWSQKDKSKKEKALAKEVPGIVGRWGCGGCCCCCGVWAAVRMGCGVCGCSICGGMPSLPPRMRPASRPPPPKHAQPLPAPPACNTLLHPPNAPLPCTLPCFSSRVTCLPACLPACRIQQAVQLLRKGMPTTTVLILGELPRGTGTGKGLFNADNDFSWPSHYAAAVTSINSKLK